MRSVAIVVAVLLALPPMALGVVGARFTWNKLDKMKQIRGFVPAEDVRTLRVLEKAKLGRVHWVRWNNEAPITAVGPHRFDLPAAAFARYSVGDPIEAVFFPDSEEPYPRETVFAEDGNFMFDRVLLAIELGAIAVPAAIVTIVVMFVRRRQVIR